MRRSILAATGSLTLLACVGITQASTIFSDGFDTLYKPGTGRTVTATFTGYTSNEGSDSFGTNAPVSAGLATYSDGTDGNTKDAVGNLITNNVDIPNWTPNHGNWGGLIGTNPWGIPHTTGPNVVYTNGYSSGQGGPFNLTSDAFGSVDKSLTYTLSVDFGGGSPVGPQFADLLVNGVALTPSSSSSPAVGGGGFVTWTRTYDASSLSALSGGESLQVRIGTGTDTADGGTVNAGQTWMDSVKVTDSAVPEPAALGLLGLMGLGLVKRRR